MPRLHNQTNKPLDENVRSILEKMFSEYEDLIVKTEFTEGYSDSRVFLVRPRRPISSELPAIVKIGPRMSVQHEWEAFQHCIQHRLPTAAGIQHPPIFEKSMGGLRYQQIGEGTFDVESLARFCFQASVPDIEYVLRQRLFNSLSKIWKDKHLQPDMLIRAAYDSILPVNLVVEVSNTGTDVDPNELNATNPNIFSGNVDDFVRITDFQVTEIFPSQQKLLLDSPDLSYRLYATRVPNIGQYQIGDIISTPLTGQIKQTRAAFLAGEAKKIISSDINLQADQLQFFDGTLLPNPLIALADVLPLSFDVYTACIHGDLHLHNVLIEPVNRNAYLIDFGKAHEDHVLRDFIHLEMSVLTGLLPAIMTERNMPLVTIRTFYENLHKATINAEPYFVPSELAKPFAILQVLRQEAQEYLYRPNQWQEYYAGLFIYLLSALKFDNLNATPNAPLPKQLAFWGAAVIRKLMAQVPAQESLPLFHRPAVENQWERSRPQQIMIDKMYSFWIEGVLRQSLHENNLIELDMETRLGAVEHPWHDLLQFADDPPEQLSSFKLVEDSFVETGSNILILGEPGAGKTTMLLTLARTMLRLSRNDLAYPIPVVFMLSTWKPALPLFQWLVNELNEKYLIPKPLANSWLKNDLLLLMLDGLDEVDPAHQNGCVRAINHFRQEHMARMVICSRTEAYESLSQKLKLDRAIMLRPLTTARIYTYLDAEGLNPLKSLLQNHAPLRELARTPLMLNMMMITFSDLFTLAQTTEKEIDQFRLSLLRSYISTMFSRRPQKKYVSQQSIYWLSWLAQNMSQHAQHLFLIEHLQPSWLSTSFQQFIYFFLTRIMAGLVIGFALSLGIYPSASPSIDPPWLVLPIWLILGVMGGSLIGLIDWFHAHRSRQKFIYLAGIGLIGGAIGGLFGWAIGWPIGELSKIVAGPNANNLLGGIITGSRGTPVGMLINQTVGGLMGATFSSLIFMLVFGLRGLGRQITNDIQIQIGFTWSWRSVTKGALAGVSFGILLGLLLGSRFGLMIGTITSIITSIFSGYRGRLAENESSPQTILWLSTRNALVNGIILGTALGFVITFIGDVTLGITYGVSLGLLAVFWYGGLDVLQHFLLRFILWQSGLIDWKLNSFLDYSVKRIFMRKVGNGYIFIHRILQDYFASKSINQELG